jgi:hypothetical protein
VRRWNDVERRKPSASSGVSCVITINEHRQTGGFRVKLDLLQKLSRRQRRVMSRIDKANCSGQSLMIAPPVTTVVAAATAMSSR